MNTSIEISRITEATEEFARAVARLIPQLSPSLAVPTAEWLREVAKAPDNRLYAASAGGRTAGMLTLCICRLPSGCKAWIEDVVVDERARGLGIARALVRTALKEAAEAGAAKVQLTSSAARRAAHALYESEGFERYDTQVFVRKTNQNI